VIDDTFLRDDEIRDAFSPLDKAERTAALALSKFMIITKQAELTYNHEWTSSPSDDMGGDLPLVVLWGDLEFFDGHSCNIYINRLKIEAELKRLEVLRKSDLEPIVTAVSVLLRNAALLTVDRLCDQHNLNPQDLFVNRYA